VLNAGQPVGFVQGVIGDAAVEQIGLFHPAGGIVVIGRGRRAAELKSAECIFEQLVHRVA
jgi:hypothetical protein